MYPGYEKLKSRRVDTQTMTSDIIKVKKRPFEITTRAGGRQGRGEQWGKNRDDCN